MGTNSMMTMEEINDNFRSLGERIKILTDQYETLDEKIYELGTKVENMTKARWIITEVQRLTQQRFKEKMENLVTLAIQSVFSKRHYEFELKFEEKRNQMEVKPIIHEWVNGVKYTYESLEDDFGGGMIDIVSIAMRVVLWSMEKPASRNVIILDEPGKNLGAMINVFGKILKEISHKLNFQLIVITHDEEILDNSDRAYLVSHEKGVSNVALMREGQRW